MTNYLKMTQKELDINNVMDRLIKKEMLLKEASERINKSKRQTIRIKNKYKKEGSAGLIHKSRGKPSNNKISEFKYIKPIQIIKDNYHDYGPTLSAEILAKKHKIFIPVSTLRLHMITELGYGKIRLLKSDLSNLLLDPEKMFFEKGFNMIEVIIFGLSEENELNINAYL